MEKVALEFALKNNANFIFIFIGALICAGFIGKLYAWFRSNVPSKTDLDRLVDKIDSAMNATNNTMKKSDESIKELNKAIHDLSVSIVELSKKQAYIEGSLKI